MRAIAVYSPAKINLYLAVTGRRPDGFHDLLSLAVPLDFGDTVWLSDSAPPGEARLTCSAVDLPTGPENLACRAAALFREETGWTGGLHIELTKRIPWGAGLGGGSSNAVAVLAGLGELTGMRLDPSRLESLAGRLGSDCPLFLRNRPVIMRGRGEALALLPKTAEARIRGTRILLFKPPFAVSTAVAYARLAAGVGGTYSSPAEAEPRLGEWLRSGRAVGELLHNDLEVPVFSKYLALPVLIARLRSRFALPVLMTGSGSACFILLEPGSPVGAICREITEAWGEAAFLQVAKCTWPEKWLLTGAPADPLISSGAGF